MRSLQKLICFILVLIAPTSAALENKQVINIIESDTPPVGVVFEVMEWEDGNFEEVLKTIERYSEELKYRHPNIDFAVVSHGAEQFSLLKENEQSKGNIHLLTQSLVDDGISVEVCATHASWRGNEKDDFAEHIKVVDRAPVMIREYQSRGYILIRL
ncbi:DsrE family protein [Aliivibrio sp. EL58]|uniref:DsrE family protein n=1 Tax=Aliivibrio sp. EL58 TaxID=2107582 RepID=UPI000EFC6C0E|nr:DsrE family protein [Aliivibrio sp. EL58]